MGYFTLKQSGPRRSFAPLVGLFHRLAGLRPRNVCLKQGRLCLMMLCGAVILYGCGRKTDPIPAETEAKTVYFYGDSGSPLVQTVSCKPVRYRYPKD